MLQEKLLVSKNSLAVYKEQQKLQYFAVKYTEYNEKYTRIRILHLLYVPRRKKFECNVILFVLLLVDVL